MSRGVVVYVAGPYRAATPWGILRNVRAAMEVALAVWRLGYTALCPHGNTALFDGEAEDDAWLAGDLELLDRCDGMIALGGPSRGVAGEIAYAAGRGIPVLMITGADDPGIAPFLASLTRRGARSVPASRFTATEADVRPVAARWTTRDGARPWLPDPRARALATLLDPDAGPAALEEAHAVALGVARGRDRIARATSTPRDN